MRRIQRLLGHPVLWIVVLWAVAVGARLIRSGAVYGLDYTLFQPDGTLYHALTLRLLGHSWADLSAEIVAFYQQHSLRGLPADWHMDAESPWVTIVYGRPLYSLLSVPFVALAGQWGMLAVPALSLLAIGLSLVAIGRRVQAVWPGVLVFGVLTFSTTVMRWSVSNLTDSLQLALVGTACLLLVTNRDRLWLLLPVGAGLLTRPSGPIWIALLLPFALRESQNRGKMEVVMALALAGTAAVIMFSPAAAGVSLTDMGPFMERLAAWTWRSVSVSFMEVAQLGVLDRPLLTLMIAAFVLALRSLDDVWSQALLSVLAVTVLLDGWVGVIGVNFRYQLPCLFPAGIVVMRAARDYLAARQPAAPTSSPVRRLVLDTEPAVVSRARRRGASPVAAMQAPVRASSRRGADTP